MNYLELDNFERKLEKLFQNYQQLLRENLALRKECALLSEKNEKAIANIKHIVGQLREENHGRAP